MVSASLLFGAVAWQQVPVWSGTISLYEHLLRCTGDHPDRSRFDYILGEHYHRAGMTNEARESFARAVAYESRRTTKSMFNEGVLKHAHFRLGNMCAERGDLAVALAHYQAALVADPQFPAALVQGGATLNRLRRSSDALVLLREAVRLVPNDASARHELGVALDKMGNVAEAREQFAIEQRLQSGSLAQK